MKKLQELQDERRVLLVKAYKIDIEIWELLKKHRTILNKRDKKIYKILKARLHEKKTLDELGREMGVTRERIRQIESLGYALIKHYEKDTETKNL